MHIALNCGILNNFRSWSDVHMVDGNEKVSYVRSCNRANVGTKMGTLRYQYDVYWSSCKASNVWTEMETLRKYCDRKGSTRISHRTNTPTDLINKSHNAPVPYYTMFHSEQKCAHFCCEWSIVGYGTGVFWDLWNWSSKSADTDTCFELNMKPVTTSRRK